MSRPHLSSRAPLRVGEEGRDLGGGCDRAAGTGVAVHPQQRAEQVVEWATIGGAKALGLGDKVGSLEVGKQADVVLIKNDRSPAMFPVLNPYGHVVYQATRGDVHTVLVDGKGSLWVGTQNGLNLLDRERGAFRVLARAGNAEGGYVTSVRIGDGSTLGDLELEIVRIDLGIAQRRVQRLDQLGVTPHAERICRKLFRLFNTEYRTERGPVTLSSDRDLDGPVRCKEHPIGRERRVVVAARVAGDVGHGRQPIA